MNKILVIEDDVNICGIIEDILSKYGKIHCAASKKEADRYLEENYYDLIIADYYLGDHNGLDIVQSINENEGHVPVILISAFPTVDMLQTGIDLQVLAFLRKPLNFELLIDKVESALLFDANYNFGQHKITLRNSSFGFICDGEETQLTEIQFKMMKYFLDNANKVMERDRMVTYIWGAKKIASENILDTHLLNLKKRVPLLKDHLRTLPRIGYVMSSEKKNGKDSEE